MFGNIICPGLTASVSFTPFWLYSQLKNICGSLLVGLWIGDDAIVDGSNNVLSVTGRVGGNAPSVGASYLTRVSLNGRYFLANTQVATTVALRTASLTAKYIYSVQRSRELPFANYRCAIGSTGPTVAKLALAGETGTSNWHSGSGWRHYEPYGVVNEVVQTGVHVARSMSTAAGDTDTWEIGGRLTNGAARNWVGDIGIVAMLNAQPSSGVDALVTQCLRTYYNL